MSQSVWSMVMPIKIRVANHRNLETFKKGKKSTGIQHNVVDGYDMIKVGNTKTVHEFKQRYKQPFRKRNTYFENRIGSKSSNFSI